MSTDLDRRKFLTQSGTALGGLLASPRLGLLAVAAGAIAGAAVDGGAAAAAGDARGPRLLLRAGEPVNGRGEPFGHDISGLAVVPAPAARPGSRLLVVVGHDEPRGGCEERFSRRSYGLSTLELIRDPAGRWRHEVASDHNRRWSGDSRLAVDGARIVPDAPAFRVRSEGEFLGRIASVEATPWQTAVACERDGWLVEVNPLTGHAVRRFSLGCLGAKAVRFEAAAGVPVTVELRAPRHLFRFVSHQSFDPRRPQANQSILLIGELSVYSGSEWIELTKGLGTEEWSKLMREPYLDARVQAAELSQEQIAAEFGEAAGASGAANEAAGASDASGAAGGGSPRTVAISAGGFSAVRDEIGFGLSVDESV